AGPGQALVGETEVEPPEDRHHHEQHEQHQERGDEGPAGGVLPPGGTGCPLPHGPGCAAGTGTAGANGTSTARTSTARTSRARTSTGVQMLFGCHCHLVVFIAGRFAGLTRSADWAWPA